MSYEYIILYFNLNIYNKKILFSDNNTIYIYGYIYKNSSFIIFYFEEFVIFIYKSLSTITYTYNIINLKSFLFI